MDEFPERWLERACTPERVAQCRAHVAAWLQTQDKETVSEQAQQLGLTLVPVNDVRDLHASAQYAFRGYFSDVQHPRLGHRSEERSVGTEGVSSCRSQCATYH